MGICGTTGWRTCAGQPVPKASSGRWNGEPDGNGPAMQDMRGVYPRLGWNLPSVQTPVEAAAKGRGKESEFAEPIGRAGSISANRDPSGLCIHASQGKTFAEIAEQYGVSRQAVDIAIRGAIRKQNPPSRPPKPLSPAKQEQAEAMRYQIEKLDLQIKEKVRQLEKLRAKRQGKEEALQTLLENSRGKGEVIDGQ